VSRRADVWIRRTTIGCVGLLALIAGMIVAASTTLLAESRSGRLLAVGGQVDMRSGAPGRVSSRRS
jgi:hypothetical protein